VRDNDSRKGCVLVQELKEAVEPVGSRPVARSGALGWWRRGDSTFHSFRCGLDYAFIHAASRSAWMRSVLFERSNPFES
jgi:hypothetical protein